MPTSELKLKNKDLFRSTVALLVSSIVLRLRIKCRFTFYITDTSRATAAVRRLGYTVNFLNFVNITDLQ